MVNIVIAAVSTFLSLGALISSAVGLSQVPSGPDLCFGQISIGGGERFNLAACTAYTAIIFVVSLISWCALTNASPLSAKKIRNLYTLLVLFFTSFWFTASLRAAAVCGNVAAGVTFGFACLFAILLSIGAFSGFTN